MSMFSNVISSRSDLDWCWYLRKHGAIGERMERALHDIGVLYPGGWARWQNSTMTDTGAPTEVIFNSASEAMTLRTEVDNPGADPKGRVAKACAVITAMGHTPPPAALREVISAAQSDSPLRYGAWLGLRISQTQAATTLFAEMPAGADDLAGLVSSAAVTDALRNLGEATPIKMLAFDCATHETTIFCETTQDIAEILPTLAKVAEVPVAPLQPLIKKLGVVARPEAQGPRKFGFGFTMPDDGSAPRLTLQFSAKEVFAGDASVTPMVRDYPGCHHRAYAALADMLLPAPAGQMHHGTIGLHAQKTGLPQLSIGVAAPWACPFESH